MRHFRVNLRYGHIDPHPFRWCTQDKESLVMAIGSQWCLRVFHSEGVALSNECDLLGAP